MLTVESLEKSVRISAKTRGEDPELAYVVDSQDREALADYIPNWQEYGCFFVQIDKSGADYARIWGCSRSYPGPDTYVELVYSKAQRDREIKKRMAKNAANSHSNSSAPR